jgi:hypothetical protein
VTTCVCYKLESLDPSKEWLEMNLNFLTKIETRTHNYFLEELCAKNDFPFKCVEPKEKLRKLCSKTKTEV